MARRKRKKTTETKLTLAPLALETAVFAALSTGKAPPAPKRKPKGKK